MPRAATAAMATTNLRDMGFLSGFERRSTASASGHWSFGRLERFTARRPGGLWKPRGVADEARPYSLRRMKKDPSCLSTLEPPPTASCAS